MHNFSSEKSKIDFRITIVDYFSTIASKLEIKFFHFIFRTGKNFKCIGFELVSD